jgi:hypothetical protein
MGRAACNRSSARQWPNGTPAPVANALRECPLARPHVPAPLAQRAPVGGVSPQLVGHLSRGLAGGHPDLDRGHRDRGQQVGEHRLGVSALGVIKGGAAEVADEFGQQGAGRDRGGLAGLGPAHREQARPDVQGAHGGAGGGGGLVRQPRRYPQRPCRGKHPGRVRGQDGEHPARRPGQLVVFVDVPLEAGSGGHGERRHEDDPAVVPGVFAVAEAYAVCAVRPRTMSGSRHNMAAYAVGRRAPERLASGT